MFSIYDLLNSKRNIDKAVLDYKLNQLKLAEKSDLRMLDSAQQRFSAKYGAYDNIQITKAADVRMYRTHNPGFCYHRDGQQRTSDIVMPTIDRPDYQEIVDLLLTNGEIDCEKLICFHALSTHPCGPLLSPYKSYRTLPSFSQELSNCDRMPKTSRNQSARSSILPIYILNLNKNESKSMQEYNQCLQQNARLATRLFVNKTITLLVQTIMEALQKSNSEKIPYLLNLAKNTQRVKQIMVKPEHEEFIKKLYEQKLLWSSKSYEVSWPISSVVLLNIETATDNLINLVRMIRYNVYKPKHASIHAPGKENNIIKYSLPYPFDKTKKESAENEDEDESRVFNAEKIAIALNNKVRESYERDMEELRKSLKTPASSSSLLDHGASTSSRKYPDPLSSAVSKKSKFQKRTPLRCMEKKIFQATLSESTQFLTNIIEKERVKMKKIEDAQRRGQSSNKAGVTNEKRNSVWNERKTRTAKYYTGISSYATVNNLKLNMIKHDISFKENSKRVKKFLEEPLFEKNI